MCKYFIHAIIGVSKNLLSLNCSLKRRRSCGRTLSTKYSHHNMPATKKKAVKKVAKKTAKKTVKKVAKKAVKKVAKKATKKVAKKAAKKTTKK